jgi:hypothetical protein
MRPQIHLAGGEAINVLPAASQGNPNSTNGRFCPMKRPFSIMDGIGVFWALS